MVSSGSALGHSDPEHRSEALPRLSVVSISMCLLVLALLIRSVQAGRSVLNELDVIRNGFTLEDLDDPCQDSLLDCVMGK